MIRILLADDQTLLRQGLKVILTAEPDLEVIGEAKDGAEAVDLARRLKPDVILLDIRMPGIDGIEAARQVRGENGPRVILLTTYDDDDLVLRGMQAGAAGYLLKDQPAEEIVEAIRSVSRGQAIFRTSGAGRVLVRITEAASTLPVSTSGIDGLTARESEVLCLIAEGLSNRQIAAHLVIAEATVKTHVNNIFGKLGFQDRAQAVAHAFRAGLIKS